MGQTASAWAAALALGVIAATPAAALDKLSFGTSWLPDAERGGFYQAAATGIFQKYGLDVTIVPGGPQINNPQLLVAGRLDAVLLSSGLEPLNYAKNGVPLVAVASIYQKNPQILMAHKALGVSSLADLKGKPIMISSLSRNGYWLWLKSAYGYTDDQIRPYTFNLAAFLNDTKAVQQGYVTYEPYAVAKQGAEPVVFLMADHGFKDYASLLTFRKETIDAKPDLVQRFVDACIEGWASFLYGDPAPGLAMIKGVNTQITDDLLANSIKSMKEYGIVDSGDAKTLGIGAMTEARWTALFEDMVKAEGFTPGDYWRAAFDLRFANKQVAMPR